MRNAFGEPFPGTGMLSLRREAEGLFVSVPIGPEGGFEIAAAPGAWQLVVRVAGAPGEGIELGEVELPSVDLARDVTVPGMRLSGSVRRRSGEPVRRSPRGGLTVSVRPKGHDYPAAFRHAPTDEEGRYTLDGLEPGLWVVAVHPGALSPEDPIEVTIVAGEPLVVLDLVLAD